MIITVIVSSETENKHLKHPKQAVVSELVICMKGADRSVSGHVHAQKTIRGVKNNMTCRHDSTNEAVCPVATRNQSTLTTS